MTIAQAYSVFLKNLEARNSLCTVFKTVSCSLRQKLMKILTPHDVCACIFHVTYDFLIKVRFAIEIKKLRYFNFRHGISLAPEKSTTRFS